MVREEVRERLEMRLREEVWKIGCCCARCAVWVLRMTFCCWVGDLTMEELGS